MSIPALTVKEFSAICHRMDIAQQSLMRAKRDGLIKSIKTLWVSPRFGARLRKNPIKKLIQPEIPDDGETVHIRYEIGYLYIAPSFHNDSMTIPVRETVAVDTFYFEIEDLK